MTLGIACSKDIEVISALYEGYELICVKEVTVNGFTVREGASKSQDIIYLVLLQGIQDPDHGILADSAARKMRYTLHTVLMLDVGCDLHCPATVLTAVPAVRHAYEVSIDVVQCVQGLIYYVLAHICPGRKYLQGEDGLLTEQISCFHFSLPPLPLQGS